MFTYCCAIIRPRKKMQKNKQMKIKKTRKYPRELEIAICYANNALAASITTDAYFHFSFPLFAHLHKMSTKTRTPDTPPHRSYNYSAFCPIVVHIILPTNTISHIKKRQKVGPRARATEREERVKKNDLMISIWLFVAFAFYLFFGCFIFSYFSFHGLTRVMLNRFHGWRE